MSDLISRLVEVSGLIDATVTVEQAHITAGEPASSDNCSAVYVWADRIYDSPVPFDVRTEPGCFYRRTYDIRYRIDLCHQIHDDGSELTQVEALTEAVSLYDMADDVFCALTAAAVDGTLFTGADCEHVVIGEITFGVDGDRVSAAGSVRVTWPCEPEGS
jgi:hypothetical protein